MGDWGGVAPSQLPALILLYSDWKWGPPWCLVFLSSLDVVCLPSFSHPDSRLRGCPPGPHGAPRKTRFRVEGSVRF